MKTDKGFYVVKLTGRRKELNRTFEEVKRQIQNRLYRDTRTKSLEDFVANLRTKAKVQIYDDKLNAVPIDTTTPTAPGVGAADPDVGGGPPADPSGLRGKMPMRWACGMPACRSTRAPHTPQFDAPAARRSFVSRFRCCRIAAAVDASSRRQRRHRAASEIDARARPLLAEPRTRRRREAGGSSARRSTAS